MYAIQKQTIIFHLSLLYYTNSFSQFTAPDLAHIAQEVDRKERESLDVESYEDASANMDDTGT